MRARTFTLSVAAIAAVALLGVAAANLLIDPQGVFGGAEGRREPNLRYAAFTRYAQGAETYEGLVFGSSRGIAFDVSYLGTRLGDVRFANFSVPVGLLPDHLPVLRHVLDDKAARGQRLRAVALLLDVDMFGVAPITGTLNATLPPAVTGESAWKFWWANLIALQPAAWTHELTGGPRDRGPTLAPAGVPTTGVPTAAAPSPADRAPGWGGASVDAPMRIRRLTGARDHASQLRMLAEFVALCRRHGVDLRVAAMPLSVPARALVDRKDAERSIEMLGEVVPFVDFSFSRLGEDPALWQDPLHFTVAASRLMIDEMVRDLRAPGVALGRVVDRR
jgi:hypothetical protein